MGSDDSLRSHGCSDPISIKLSYTIGEYIRVEYRIDFNIFDNNPQIILEECQHINNNTGENIPIIKFNYGSGLVCNFKEENTKYDHHEKELISNRLTSSFNIWSG